MKKILFVLAISAFLISASSCGNKKQKAEEKAVTHSHEDGTVHAGETHTESNETIPKQESFEIKAEDAEHEHANGENHVHNLETK